MSDKISEQNNRTILQTERLKRYAHLIEQQTGRAIRPARFDGYVNLINRYGTEKDTSEHYQFQAEPTVPDEVLTEFYEGNGLFAKIIDAPAEEAIKHGFSLADVKDQKLIDFYQESLEELDWEETAINSLRWARLFGGSIAVMLVNDGKGIDEPLDWKNIRSIDDIRVYDRSVIQPDYTSMFTYSPEDPFRTRGSRLGMPEYYHIFSKYGSFTVHESRCLVFRNGVLPENCSNSIYELWGMPEYIRIRKAIQNSELAHNNGPKLLEKSVQAVYKMKDLAHELSTEEGESRVLRRLQIIDMARGMLNSIAIDNDNEDYDFKTFQFTGVSEIIDTTCNQLSALTSIPQTILFGRSPAGMNSTGESDMENWYNFVERIQKRMLKSNLRYLLSIIFQAGVATGEVDEVPKIKPDFKPLWSLSELEQANLEQTKANTQQTRANTAQVYVSMQAIDSSEVRSKLAESEEFDVENMLDDLEDEDLESFIEGLGKESDAESPESQGNSPDAAPAATKLPQDMSEKEKLAIKKDGGPGSGNFGHKGVEGQLGGSAMGTGKGVDTIQEASTKIKGVKIEEPEDKTKKISKPFFEKIGFCGKPSIVSENDFNSSESDYPVQYRGIALNDAYEKFVGDDFFVGSGANGDGTNTTPDEITAKNFAGKDGGVIEIKLDKSAKVISDTELMEKMGEFMNAEPPEGVDKTVFYHLTSDPGCIAASLGYDAISDSSTGWLNIVNRSKMIVKEQETSKSPHSDGSNNFTHTTQKGKNSFSVGVIVVSEGKILCGRRHNDFGYGLICGPGGHIEPGETPEQAAFRETEEEFGISPKELIPLGLGSAESETGLTPILYLCTDYIGKPDCVDLEITNPKFMSLEEIEMKKETLFKPFKDGVDKLLSLLDDETLFDGGSGSGNFGHEGVPGKVGGSLPSGKSLNDRMKEAFNYKANGKGYEEVSKEIRSILKELPNGSKVKINGITYEKIDNDKFSYEWKEGKTTTAVSNYVANQVDAFDPATMPHFEEPKTEEVAEAEFKAGRLNPKSTDVKIPSLEPEAYKGNQVVDVSKEQFQSLREELQNNTGKDVPNDEIKSYLDAIDTYRGSNYVDVVAASANFEGGYKGYSSHLSTEDKKKAKAQADTLERFIKNADKYEGKVMRALGFDLGGVSDDGTATKQFETLISNCKPGQKINMGHISSWSTEQSSITQILDARSGVDETAERSVQVVFTCQKSKNGVDIGRFSKSFTQGEVAFAKNQQFVVKSVKQKEIGDGDWPMTKYEIEVEETM